MQWQYNMFHQSHFTQRQSRPMFFMIKALTSALLVSVVPSFARQKAFQDEIGARQSHKPV
jgi:hypothetical protein